MGVGVGTVAVSAGEVCVGVGGGVAVGGIGVSVGAIVGLTVGVTVGAGGVYVGVAFGVAVGVGISVGVAVGGCIAPVGGGVVAVGNPWPSHAKTSDTTIMPNANRERGQFKSLVTNFRLIISISKTGAWFLRQYKRYRLDLCKGNGQLVVQLF